VNYLFQTRLIYRHLACLQCFDFLQVVIDANNVMPDVRKTCAGNETDITRTDDCEVHKQKNAATQSRRHERPVELKKVNIVRGISFIALRN
jgi:hypothetical protein